MAACRLPGAVPDAHTQSLKVAEPVVAPEATEWIWDGEAWVQPEPGPGAVMAPKSTPKAPAIVAPSPTAPDGGLHQLTAGHDGAFFMGAADGDYLMELFGLFQGRWVGTFRGSETGRPSVSPDDDSETGFEFRRVELGVRGHVVDPRLGYVFVLATEDGAGGVEQIIAQDIVLSYAMSDSLKVTIGRYFAPFLREELNGGGGSMASALSFMNNVLSIGRAEGISLLWEGSSARGHFFINDGAGSGGGGGVNNTTADAVDWAASARGEFMFAGDWSQWGGFSSPSGEDTSIIVGAAAHYQQGETGDSLPQTDMLAWTIDGTLKSDGLSIFAALAGNDSQTSSLVDDDMDSFGLVGQVGYRIDKIEPFIRYEHVFFDKSLGYTDDEVALFTMGVNYHANSNMKVAFDTVWAFDSIPVDSLNAGLLADGTEDGQVAVRLQLQVSF